MKIAGLLSGLLKRTIVITILLSIYIGCMLLMEYALGKTSDGQSFSSMDFSSLGVGILGICIWIAYWTICDEYGSLSELSTKTLIALLTLSSLSALVDIFAFIDYFGIYMPYLTKKVEFSTYILFVQMSILGLMISMLNLWIACRSAHTLYTKLSSKN